MADEREVSTGDRSSTEYDVAIAANFGKTKRTEARWAAVSVGFKSTASVVTVILGYLVVPSPTTIVVWITLAVVFGGGFGKIMWDRWQKGRQRARITNLEDENNKLHSRIDELVDRMTSRNERSDE